MKNTTALTYIPFALQIIFWVSIVLYLASSLKLQNEIRWIQVNKVKACSALSTQAYSYLQYAKSLNKDAYDDTKTANGINQAFVGTLLTAVTIERTGIHQQQVHYGCPVWALGTYSE